MEPLITAGLRFSALAGPPRSLEGTASMMDHLVADIKASVAAAAAVV